VNGRLDCAKLGVPTQLLFYDELAAWIALARGQLEDAAAIAETGIEDASQLDLDAPTADLLQLLVQVALHRGDLTAARRHLAHFERVAANAALHGTGYDTSTGRVAFAQGDVAGALDSLQPVYADPHNMLMHQNNTVPFVPELIRIALAGDAGDCAEAASRSAHEMAATNPAVDSVVGAAHHGDGLLRSDGDALREAVDHYRASPRPLWVAAGVEDLAVYLTEHGEREEAIALHDEAMNLYHDAGAMQDAKRNRARLRDLGVRKRQPASDARPVTGWEALSSAERDVAHLAADGLTNRAIAERLYLSPHTVTTHLKHVFTKLDVHSRVELARLAPSA
jgi:DNA-binding CsgD family transcriptional regulator